MTENNTLCLSAEQVEQLQAELNEKELNRKMMQWQSILPHIERLTEGEQADIFSRYLRQQGKSFKHCVAFGWMYFERIGEHGGKWCKGSEKELQTCYTDFVKEQMSAVCNVLINTPSTDEYKRKELQRILSFIGRMDNRHSVDNVLSLLKGKISLNADAEQFDAEANVINTPSGIVDLRTGEIRDAQPEDYCTHITGADLPQNGAEGLTMWTDFLDMVTCHDSELIAYLQLCAGMFLFGKVKDEMLYIALGNGNNGKSTLFNTLSLVMGDYSTSGNVETLIDEKGQQHKSFELASLKGKRLVIYAELEEGKRLNTAVLKKIASSDRIHAEIKYHDSFDYWPSHTPVLFTNNMPAITATDKGTWRRISIIPFDFDFDSLPKEQLIKDYFAVLIEKAGSSILQWMIEGALMLYDKGFKIPVPSKVKNMVNSFRQSSDTVLQFLKACDYSDEQAKTKRGDLFNAYHDFCERTGIQNPVKKSTFFQRIEQEGYTCRAYAGNYYFFGITAPVLDAEETR